MILNLITHGGGGTYHLTLVVLSLRPIGLILFAQHPQSSSPARKSGSPTEGEEP